MFGARMESNTVASRGRRLRRGIPVTAIIIVVVVVAVFWLLNALPMFSSF